MKWRSLGLDLAQQALAQSQDRFAAGVTNNVEVIQAQQQLAAANEQYIASLYAHNIAKVLLARAIGNAEQAVKQYLAEPGSTSAEWSHAAQRHRQSRRRDVDRSRAEKRRRLLRNKMQIQFLINSH